MAITIPEKEKPIKGLLVYLQRETKKQLLIHDLFLLQILTQLYANPANPEAPNPNSNISNVKLISPFSITKHQKHISLNIPTELVLFFLSTRKQQ